MIVKAVFLVTFLSNLVSLANAECANACNGHGRCTSYDMCICNRNWQANDCSERVCQFGLAHVDTPKGDLNHDGVISGPDKILVENSFVYPFGTTEQFPRMQDSDLADQSNSGHFYMECSNKGICNRETGNCECFDGYDGSACQRASCPGYPKSCSGHGVCKTIRQLARADYNNIYELWDRDSTMGCECDAGFTGPDCSLRECKHGVDPLYLDDTATIKYSAFDFAVVTTGSTATFTDGMTDAGTGYWAIRFFDIHGEDWLTKPIPAGASCKIVIAALNELPNNVIRGPLTEDLCTLISATNHDPVSDASNDLWSARDNFNDEYIVAPNMTFWDHEAPYYSSYDTSSRALSGYVYRIHFNTNPGKIREPEVEIYLDGRRPSLVSPGETVFTRVWTDGWQGESVDYFADHCDGVNVKIVEYGNEYILSDFEGDELATLKSCLGTADDNDGNNVEVYDWDYGSNDYPHLIKLVLSTASLSQGGYYAAIKFDGTRFVLMNRVKPYEETDRFEVYTTKGVLARTSQDTSVAFDFASKKWWTSNQTYDGDLSCETVNSDTNVDYCLNKTDIITFLSVDPEDNPRHINLYTVTKLFQEELSGYDRAQPLGTNFRRAHVITTDLSTNWATTFQREFFVYKFFPSSDSSYNYVAECSNRGICNQKEGLCECFGGYTGDSCSDQNSLSV